LSSCAAIAIFGSALKNLLLGEVDVLQRVVKQIVQFFGSLAIYYLLLAPSTCVTARARLRSKASLGAKPLQGTVRLEYYLVELDEHQLERLTGKTLAAMFFFFSNRMGVAGLILVSLLLSIVLLYAPAASS
jgi:hypothetical protein